MDVRRVVRDDDPAVAPLLADGWTIVARSFGAVLCAETMDRSALVSMTADASVREAGSHDMPALIALDQLTRDDYPGGVATHPRPLVTPPAPGRRAFVAHAGTAVVAMTWLDVVGDTAETDVTVVRADTRGRGLAGAVKAASLLAAAADGVRTFRTGGSFENPGIMRVNAKLGYVIDERWVTLEPPAERC